VPYRAAGRPEHTRRDLITVVVLLVTGIFLMSLNLDQQLTVVRALRGTVLVPVIGLHNVFAQRSRISQRLAQLQDERDELARELAAARVATAENASLRALIAAGERPSGDFLPAAVVPGRPSIGRSHSFVLLAGREDGLDPPTAILTGHGLVGVVRTVASRTAVGDFWTHPDYRVSVRTEDGQNTGIIRAFPADADQPTMLLEGAPFQTEIPAGTLLVTTGLYGIYPPGIPVGRVREVATFESGWEKSYTVEPLVRPELVDVALVWLRAAPPEER
jgi:rod shape-determining protein MreC